MHVAYFLPVISFSIVLTNVLYSHVTRNHLNPFKLDGISHCYQLDLSVSVLRVVGCFFFIFYSNLERTIYKQTVETLIRHRVLRRLIWVCTVCLFTTKRTLVIIWVKCRTPNICRNSELFYTWYTDERRTCNIGLVITHY